jgi:hypothetical protein
VLNDSKFVGGLLAKNLRLGMQTRVTDNGVAIEQTLKLIDSGAEDATISPQPFPTAT